MTKKYVPPKHQTPVDSSQMVWCPLCDWRLADSITARKRMGMHIANAHSDEVLFQKGSEPKDLERNAG